MVNVVIVQTLLQYVLKPHLLHAQQDIILMMLTLPHVKYVKTTVRLVLDQELDLLMFINVNLVTIHTS